jgi:aspartyl-tRNA(Asn)/glutamyl-tRNA(Gln) amidotransferase subunit C
MDIQTVHYLAQLARIHVSDDEAAGFSKDLASILAFVDQISSVKIDTRTLTLSSHRNIARHDDVQPLKPVYDLIEIAPAHQDHFVKVPKIIE